MFSNYLSAFTKSYLSALKRKKKGWHIFTFFNDIFTPRSQIRYYQLKFRFNLKLLLEKKIFVHVKICFALSEKNLKEKWNFRLKKKKNSKNIILHARRLTLNLLCSWNRTPQKNVQRESIKNTKFYSQTFSRSDTKGN